MKIENIAVKALVVLTAIFLLSSSTAWAEPLRADTNCDGIVSTPDLDIFEEEYYKLTYGDPSTQCRNCEACGMIECGDTCVDNSTDENNCGTCGNTCESGEMCDNGTCVVNYPIPVPKTGQTTSHEDYDDGYYEKGVEWPDPRFTDNGDGTVTDNLTGLIWMKNANCNSGPGLWAAAVTFCNTRNSGECGLTDGSIEGDWRLPNRNELLSLIDNSNHLPSLPDGHPFTNAQQQSYYWTSTSVSFAPTTSAWIVALDYGASFSRQKLTSYNGIWPVRSDN